MKSLAFLNHAHLLINNLLLTTSEPHLINESELNDLVRDFDLLNIKAEPLIFRLKQWNSLQSGVNGICFKVFVAINRLLSSFLAYMENLYIAEMLVVLCNSLATLTYKKNRDCSSICRNF